MNDAKYLPNSVAQTGKNELIRLCPEHNVPHEIPVGCPALIKEQAEMEIKRWKEARKIRLREKLRLWDSAA